MVDGLNGYLCQVRSGTDLAAKMRQVFELPEAALQQMAQASRHLAETKFDEQLVLRQYLDAVASVQK